MQGLAQKVEVSVEEPLSGLMRWEVDESCRVTVTIQIDAGPAILAAVMRGDTSDVPAKIDATMRALQGALALRMATDAIEAIEAVKTRQQQDAQPAGSLTAGEQPLSAAHGKAALVKALKLMSDDPTGKPPVGKLN